MSITKQLFNFSNSKPMETLWSFLVTDRGSKLDRNLFHFLNAFSKATKIVFGILAVSFIIFLNACSNKPAISAVDIEKPKAELRMIEAEFADSVAKYGFNKSVLLFADENAVLFNDGDSLLSTMDSVKARVSRIPLNAPPPPYKLTWKPDFIDVSASGDMGYTYGFYNLTQKDKDGKEQTKRGLYLSIWKKNANGQWKLVVD